MGSFNDGDFWEHFVLFLVIVLAFVLFASLASAGVMFEFFRS